MKKGTTWDKIALLIGFTVVIVALLRGQILIVALAGLFAIWGVWTATLLITPHSNRHSLNRSSRSNALKEQQRKHSSPQLFQFTSTSDAHAEQLLLRHVNHRISAYLQSAYPDVTWEWCEQSPEKLIQQGGMGRIRIFGIPDYDYADIAIDLQANISIKLVRTIALESAKGMDSQVTPPNGHPTDPQIWYEMQAKKPLEALVTDLRSRGHSFITLHESGDVCVSEDSKEVTKEHLSNFPKKCYWDRLVQVFERNGFTAEITASGIQVSW